MIALWRDGPAGRRNEQEEHGIDKEGSKGCRVLVFRQ